MEKRPKRARGSNWNHAQTMALAELKKKASLNKEDGGLVWERIAQTLSSRFPGQIRTGAQCRRRWDTLVKVYNYIEDYCIVTGAQDHRELDEDELASLKLDTAYHQDWYDIVEQVCSQRKRKERCNRDHRLAKQSKGSSTGSYSVELPERPPNRYSLDSASTSKPLPHHEQSTFESTTACAQVSSRPSLKDRMSPEEVLSFRNENDGFVLEVTGQHEQVSHEVSQEPQILESANLLPYTFPVENRAQLREPLHYDWWDLIEIVPFETSAEIEQYGTESELTQPSYWDLKSVEFGARSKEPLQDYVRDDSLETENACSAKGSYTYKGALTGPPTLYLAGLQPHFLPYYLPEWRPPFAAPALVPPHYEWRFCAPYGSSYAGGRGFGPPPRNNLPSADVKRSSVLVNQDVLVPSATMTASASSRSSDSTISRQSRRWSLKAIVLNVLQCCYTCGQN